MQSRRYGTHGPLAPAARAAADTGTAVAEAGIVDAAAARSAGLAMMEPIDAAVERAGAGLSCAAGLGSCIWNPTTFNTRGDVV